MGPLKHELLSLCILDFRNLEKACSPKQGQHLKAFINGQEVIPDPWNSWTGGAEWSLTRVLEIIETKYQFQVKLAEKLKLKGCVATFTFANIWMATDALFHTHMTTSYFPLKLLKTLLNDNRMN
jgi:hypothetical protein